MKKRTPFCKGTRIILSVCLPIVTVSLLTLLIAYLIDRETAPVTALLYYRGALEYILASLAILLGGALLADLASAERE